MRDLFDFNIHGKVCLKFGVKSKDRAFLKSRNQDGYSGRFASDDDEIDENDLIDACEVEYFKHDDYSYDDDFDDDDGGL